MKIKKIRSIFERGSKLCSYIAVIPMFLIMLVAVIDVIAGKIFGKSISSSTELIQYMNVPLVCLAMCYVEYQNGHTRITALTKHYPRAVQKILYLLGSLVGCAVCVFIAYEAGSLMSDYLSRQTPIQGTSPIRVWPFVLIMIIGYVLTAISFVWSGISVFITLDSREAPKSEMTGGDKHAE